MGKTLILPIKKKWFDMIKSGQKTKEYRAANAVKNIGIAMIGNILPRKQSLVGIISLKDELKSN